MEIIKKGKLPEERIWNGECYNCRTVVKAKENELNVTHDLLNGLFGSHTCPLCKKTMYFYPKD